MLNQLKFLFAKYSSTQNEPEPKSIEEHQASYDRLTNIREQQNKVTTTNSYDMNYVRRRITSELSAAEMEDLRQRNRNSHNRWFNKSQLTESGSFDVSELQRRLNENAYRIEEEVIEPLPALEDTFMAFTKAEDDLFVCERAISLSGVFLAMNGGEEWDEQYTLPAITQVDYDYELNQVAGYEFDDFGEEQHQLVVIAQAYETYCANLVAHLNDAYAAFVSPQAEEVLAISEADYVQEVRKPFSFSLFGDLESIDSEFEAHQVEAAMEVAISITIEQVQTQPLEAKTDAYWAESGRLGRFARKRTSASCSSTRLPALLPVA